MSAWRRAWLVAASAWIVSSAVAMARADVIAHLDCPPGSEVRGSHSRDCWPRACTPGAGDSQCGEGASCVRVSRCIRAERYHDGDDPEPRQREVDDGACGADGACTREGASCRELTRCEPSASSAATTTGTGASADAGQSGGCSVRSNGTRDAALGLALVVLGLTARARRRSSSRPRAR